MTVTKFSFSFENQDAFKFCDHIVIILLHMFCHFMPACIVTPIILRGPPALAVFVTDILNIFHLSDTHSTVEVKRRFI